MTVLHEENIKYPSKIWVLSYHHENRNSALFLIPRNKTIIINVCFVNPVQCMNSPLGGVKPSCDQLCVRMDCPYASPPPYHMTVVW
jgi:hypothetical protein